MSAQSLALKHHHASFGASDDPTIAQLPRSPMPTTSFTGTPTDLRSIQTSSSSGSVAVADSVLNAWSSRGPLSAAPFGFRQASSSVHGAGCVLSRCSWRDGGPIGLLESSGSTSMIRRRAYGKYLKTRIRAGWWRAIRDARYLAAVEKIMSLTRIGRPEETCLPPKTFLLILQGPTLVKCQMSHTLRISLLSPTRFDAPSSVISLPFRLCVRGPGFDRV